VATPTYHVILKRDAAKALQTIPSHIAQQAQRFIDTHLRHHPIHRIPSKLKQLKGSLSGIWQYDLPSGHRVRYRVDLDAQVVSVIYIGPHP
jgi:mRNA-degrading endonuclease RelE of RelBE toxin-antitoxin system